MKFLRLPDYLLKLLYEDDEVIAFDKPYGFNSHTNDSKIAHSEFIQDGLIEILEKQFGRRFYIIHRLDQTTTGVIVFGKTPEAAKKYAEFFFHRQVQKTYLFVTAEKSLKNHFLIDQTIIHKGQELTAETQLSFLKREKGFELWQALPKTGRNHQIRIHAQAAGISILGDEKYNGKSYPFLCLHNQRIQFPNGVQITSDPPTYFQDLSLLQDHEISTYLFEVDRRERLFSKKVAANQSFKIAIRRAMGNDLGLNIDRLGEYDALSVAANPLSATQVKLFSDYAKNQGRLVVVKHGDQHQVFGKSSKDQNGKSEVLDKPLSEFQWTAMENDLRFELRTQGATAWGLYLNQRLQRHWVRQNSKNLSVLNLFSAQAQFSVAAAMGEAKDLISVEANKNALAWGKRNFELNKIPLDRFKFLNRDSFDFIKQCQKKNQKFDLIICDTPHFARTEKGIFRIENDLPLLLNAAFHCLNPKGRLLFSTTFEGLKIDQIRDAIITALKSAGQEAGEIYSILPSLDYELADDRASLKSFLVVIK